jgi:hypothetical protein
MDKLMMGQTELGFLGLLYAQSIKMKCKPRNHHPHTRQHTAVSCDLS